MNTFTLLILTSFFTINLLQSMENTDIVSLKRDIDSQTKDFYNKLYKGKIDLEKEKSTLETELRSHINKLQKEKYSPYDCYDKNEFFKSKQIETINLIKDCIQRMPDAKHDPLVSQVYKDTIKKYLLVYGIDFKKIAIVSNKNNSLITSNIIDIKLKKNQTTVTIDQPFTFHIAETQLNRKTNIAFLVSGLSTLLEKMAITFADACIGQQTEDTITFSTDAWDKTSLLTLCLTNYKMSKWLTKDLTVFQTNEQRSLFNEMYKIKQLWEKLKLIEEYKQRMYFAHHI